MMDNFRGICNCCGHMGYIGELCNECGDDFIFPDNRNINNYDILESDLYNNVSYSSDFFTEMVENVEGDHNIFLIVSTKDDIIISLDDNFDKLFSFIRSKNDTYKFMEVEIEYETLDKYSIKLSRLDYMNFKMTINDYLNISFNVEDILNVLDFYDVVDDANSICNVNLLNLLLKKSDINLFTENSKIIQLNNLLGHPNVNKYEFKEKNDTLTESLLLNEATTITPDKRKKIESLIYKTMSMLDKSGLNVDNYKKLFSSMTNEKFSSYMKKFLNDNDDYFYLEILPNKNEPSLKEIKETLDFLKIPLTEYVYYKHDGNLDNHLRTKYKVPVGLTI